MRAAMGDQPEAPGTGPDRVVHKGKVVVVGDYSSGKTSLVHRYGTGQYLGIQEPTIAAAFQTKVVDLNAPGPVPRTITCPREAGVPGRSFDSATRGSTAATWGPLRDGGRLAAKKAVASRPDAPVHEARDCVVKLEIWDTAGSERYQSLMPMYFRDAAVALLVFDVSRRSTFEHVTRWLDAYHQHNDRANLSAMRAIIVASKSDLYAPVAVGDPSKELGGPDRDLTVDRTARTPGRTPGRSPGRSARPGLAAPTGPSMTSAALSRPPATGGAADDTEVSIGEVLALGEELGLPVCFTSAKANWNVELLFRDVATHVAAVSEKSRAAGGFGLRNGLTGPASLMLRGDPLAREYTSRDERRGSSMPGKKKRCGCGNS